MSVIRGSVLAGYREHVAELGADPDVLLRAAGLKPGDAGNHEVFIPYLSHIKAVESAAAVTGAIDFGRQLADRRQGVEILGPLGVAVRTARNIEDAVAIGAKYVSAYGPAIAVSLGPTGNQARVFYEFRILLDHLPPHAQTLELALGVSLKLFRFLLGPDYRPLQVHMTHRALAPRKDYLAYFGCAPRFEQPRAGLVLRAGDLDRPLSNDRAANEVIRRYLDTVMPSRETDLTVRATELVRHLLPTGATLDMVAQQFAMHPRTFQRRLEAHGTTYADLIDDVRRDVAERYLRDTDLSLTFIARELGYSEQSAFTRACRRWFDSSPRAYRKQISPR
ncbi:AraC family transcriptional regulator [Gordonia sp. NPDC003424]